MGTGLAVNTISNAENVNISHLLKRLSSCQLLQQQCGPYATCNAPVVSVVQLYVHHLLYCIAPSRDKLVLLDNVTCSACQSQLECIERTGGVYVGEVTSKHSSSLLGTRAGGNNCCKFKICKFKKARHHRKRLLRDKLKQEDWLCQLWRHIFVVYSSSVNCQVTKTSRRCNQFGRATLFSELKIRFTQDILPSLM